MRHSGFLVAALGLALVPVSAAHADTLLYTFTTTASGFYSPLASPLSPSFTNTGVTLSATVQSAEVQTAPVGSGSNATFTYVAGVPLTINVPGVCLCTDTSDVNFVTLNGRLDATGAVVPDVEFNDLLSDYRLVLNSPALSGDTLAMAFGPVTGTSGASLLKFFNVTTGTLEFTSEGAQSTFQVTDLSTPASVTPEPSSLLLLATGLCGVAFAARRKSLRGAAAGGS